MRFAAINPITLSNAFALGQMDATMRAGHHFLGKRIPRPCGITFSRCLTFRPHPPNCRQERKQKQVFHRSPRKQKSSRKIRKLLFLPHFNTPPPPQVIGTLRLLAIRANVLAKQCPVSGPYGTSSPDVCHWNGCCPQKPAGSPIHTTRPEPPVSDGLPDGCFTQNSDVQVFRQ